MKTFKEILKDDNSIWFLIEDEDKKDFLKYAKNNGCKWINGDSIKPNFNKIGNHMGINKSFKMGFVSMWCWNADSNNKPKIIKFNEIKE